MGEEGTVFLAGAAGAIGARLLPLLVGRGLKVYGTTRKPERAAAVSAAGATPIIVDIYERDRLIALMREMRPATVIHQLTDLPPGLDPTRMASAVAANARIRIEGTRNLVDGAKAAGALLVLAQSIAWVYAPGREPHVETDALDVDAPDRRGVTVKAVAALEAAVLGEPGFTGIVLRYGNLYGPGTGAQERQGGSPLHVDDAAKATMLALERREAGIFNITEPNSAVSSQKAARVLGWRPRPRPLSA